MKKTRRYWDGERTVEVEDDLKADLKEIWGFVKFMAAFFGILLILAFLGSLNNH